MGVGVFYFVILYESVAMIIVQNEARPGEVQNALYDLMRTEIASVRVCSAYVSYIGSKILFDGICRSSPDGDHERIPKTIVTSLDFGLTDPTALQFWMELPHCRVLIAGTSLLDQGNLIPSSAFHPKLYIFEKGDGTVGTLVGSANLTNRGLTINSEVMWCEPSHERANHMNAAWNSIIQPAVPLTPVLLERYQRLRQQLEGERPTEETEPVPAPAIKRPTHYMPFGNAGVEPQAYTQMWVQSRGMQGGAGTQLELPRGSHRFFGAAYADYDFDRVDHIAEPILISGHRRWHNRPLTWHGDNAMERINLPSRAMGGFEYQNSLILFRRIAENTFELRVYPWESDSAHAYVHASIQAGLIFRVGRNSNRLTGLLP